MKPRTPDELPACPRCAAAGELDALLDALMDRFADRLAERLAVQRSPAPYSQNNPPPGMTHRSYLDAAGRRDFPTSKIGHAVLCERSDFEAYLAKRRRDAVEHPARSGAEPPQGARTSSAGGKDELDAIMERSGTVRRRTR